MSVPHKKDYNLGVLVTGGGSNFEAIVRNFHDDTSLPAKVNFTAICNRATAGVYERANRLGVPIEHVPMWGDFPNTDYTNLYKHLEKNSYDRLVMAGFLKVLPENITDVMYKGRVLNIHPALLPLDEGAMGYKTTLERLMASPELPRVVGCTVQIAIKDVDKGPLIAQYGHFIPDDIWKIQDFELKLAKVSEIALYFEWELYPMVLKNQLFGTKIDLSKAAETGLAQIKKNLGREIKMAHFWQKAS